MAEKFFTTSPYVYVDDNPLKYTDPDGMAKLDRIIRRAKRKFRRASRRHPTANNLSITTWKGKDGNNYIMVNTPDGAWVNSAKPRPKKSKNALWLNGGIRIEGNGGWNPRQKAKNPDGRTMDMSDAKFQRMSEIADVVEDVFEGIVKDVDIEKVNPHSKDNEPKTTEKADVPTFEDGDTVQCNTCADTYIWDGSGNHHGKGKVPHKPSRTYPKDPNQKNRK